MPKSNRIQQIVKLGQEGRVPLPFSNNEGIVQTVTNSNVMKPITDQLTKEDNSTLKRKRSSSLSSTGNDSSSTTSSDSTHKSSIKKSLPISVDALRHVQNSDYTALGMMSVGNDRDNASSPSLLGVTHELFVDKENHPPLSDNEHISGVDFSPDNSDDEYQPPRPRSVSLSSTSDRPSSTSSSERPKKGKKRNRNPQKWKKNVLKRIKNSGKEYISRSGKKVDAKVMKPPCNCRLQCRTKFSDEMRKEIFESYWNLASLQRQRDFLWSCVQLSNISCRRVKNVEKPRKPNCSFSFLKNGQSIKICKRFLVNTLDISERTLRTVIEALQSSSSMAPVDNRGKHKNRKTTDPEILLSIENHINSIPRIESHYLRANTSREFIDGGLTIAEMHRNYVEQRVQLNKEAASYDTYAYVFNTKFNISFFVPKKDQCDLCMSFQNAVGEEKDKLLPEYNSHQKEKQLSREEKSKDIKICKEPDSNTLVAIYDLQAVMPVPLGESSAFFYKSKLNCLNFTVTDVKSKSTDCYFWHEGLGNRGAVEIGTCIFKFLEKIALESPSMDIVFYSDNCCGQQKNRFIFSMYAYAVKTLPIKSITHKFLVRGHTQNEGDNAHSIIERAIKSAKKSGPIYVPDQYVQIIRNARKKGNPYLVHEMDYTDFYDWKALTDDLGVNFNKNLDGDIIKLSEIRVIKFEKGSNVYIYKTSYDKEAQWSQCDIHSSKRRNQRHPSSNITLKKAYNARICISERKKEDLRHLINTNIIPKYYEAFYQSIF
ncbi:uncharacterized protein LOC123666182 [Melitaea cinxia]|uniref:uncharacterized protein LOC123664666 n=1 Tax=Melitaea cinxia TaxID=113334 RepID=UPI001E274BAD|nr:uncharacterized protein LOC123664666 [Melitaea cinxia]XP_045456336.1 uncharacterized protein LOC123666182 [Melitaea cinxia]